MRLIKAFLQPQTLTDNYGDARPESISRLDKNQVITYVHTTEISSEI